MELESIRTVVMQRDGCTNDDVDEMFAEASDLLDEGEDVDAVLQDVFGLEPDYMDDPEFMKILMP